MKKFQKIAYIILVAIIVVLFYVIYVNASKNNQVDQKQKTLTEIEWIESKIINLCNTMNNISFENYKLEVKMEEQESKTSNSQKGQSSEGDSQGGSEGGKSGNGESSDQNSSTEASGGDTNTSSKEEVKKFELIHQNVLTASDEINWDNVKSEVETIYTSIPSITLDLYQVNLNQEDILGFNKEYDNLTKAVKEENKKDTLTQLVTLYDYIPKFVKNVNEDVVYQVAIQTKAHILKAYSKLEDKDWAEIQSDVQNAIDAFNQLLATTGIDNSKQYSVNKSYVMLNELQNAVQMQEESVFLIKYKNLLEELNNI